MGLELLYSFDSVKEILAAQKYFPGKRNKKEYSWEYSFVLSNPIILLGITYPSQGGTIWSIGIIYPIQLLLQTLDNILSNPILVLSHPPNTAFVL